MMRLLPLIGELYGLGFVLYWAMFTLLPDSCQARAHDGSPTPQWIAAFWVAVVWPHFCGRSLVNLFRGRPNDWIDL